MFIKRSECEILEVIDEKKIKQSDDQKTRADLEKIAKELDQKTKKVEN
jgi:uncharacterized FlaG/YvyC family protein